MFGYVIPFKEELKLKEYKRYKNYYCALCNQIRRRYGRIATIFLSHEIVFTLILLDDFVEDKKIDSVALGCQFDFIHIGNIELSKDLIYFLGWVNLHLSLWKLRDNWLDEKKVSSYLLYKLLIKNRNYIKDCSLYKAVYHDLNLKLKLFYESEKNENCSFDELAQIMGDVWQKIFEYGSKYTSIEKNMLLLLQKVCDDLGKFLYCIDAYDDYEKDILKKQFNPLQQIQFKLDKNLNNGLFLLSFIIYNLKEKVGNGNFNKNNDIIKNVILYGLEYKLNSIVRRKEKENEGKRR